MSKQRRTADDFVRDMKAKQQALGGITRKSSEGLTSEQANASRGNRGLTVCPVPAPAGTNTRRAHNVS